MWHEDASEREIAGDDHAVHDASDGERAPRARARERHGRRRRERRGCRRPEEAWTGRMPSSPREDGDRGEPVLERTRRLGSKRCMKQSVDKPTPFNMSTVNLISSTASGKSRRYLVRSERCWTERRRRDLPEASSRRLRSEPRALRAMSIIPEKMHAPPPLGPSGRGA